MWRNYIRVEVKRTWPGDRPTPGDAQVNIFRTFEGPDFDLNDILNVFEDALRASGYECPHEHLTVVSDDEA